MADITKCNYEPCKKKDTCFRYLAESSMYQSYFSEKPYEEGEECRYFWLTKSKEEVDRANKEWED